MDWRGLYNRILMMVSGGRINLVDDSDVIQRVQVTFGNNQTGDKIPRVSDYGFSSNPPPNTDCITLSVYGDRSISVVIGTNNQQFRPKDLAEGESIMYDNAGKTIYLSASGIVINAAGTPVTVENASTVTINATEEIIANTPVLKCTGDIVDNYQTQTHTMAQMRSIYDTHTHPGVQAGSSNTGAPNQPE